MRCGAPAPPPLAVVPPARALLSAAAGAVVAAVAGARRDGLRLPPVPARIEGLERVIGRCAGARGSASAKLPRPLPGVIGAASYQGFYAAPLGADGRADPSYDAEAIGSIDGRFFDQDRVVVVKGRLAHPTRAGELVVNQVAARVYGRLANGCAWVSSAKTI